MSSISLKIIKNGIVIGLSGCGLAFAGTQPGVYLGYDYGYRHMPAYLHAKKFFPKEFGNNALELGLRVNQYFGLALGYEYNNHESNSIFGGTEIDLDGRSISNTAARQGYDSTTNYQKILAKAQLYLPASDNLDFVLGLSFAYSKLKMIRGYGTQDATGAGNAYKTSVLEFNKTKTLPTGHLGFEYCLNEHSFARTGFDFEKTGRFKNIYRKNKSPSSTVNVGLKNSVVFKIGFGYKF
ncbi:MAG: outer membrane protein [Gammaproteobacteria bacterium]